MGGEMENATKYYLYVYTHDILFICTHTILFILCTYTVLFMCVHTRYYLCVYIHGIIYVCTHTVLFICVHTRYYLYVYIHDIIYMCTYTILFICVHQGLLKYTDWKLSFLGIFFMRPMCYFLHKIRRNKGFLIFFSVNERKNYLLITNLTFSCIYS